MLPDLDIGQVVRIAPVHRGKSCEVGTCLQKLSDRSYLVETNGGEVLHRNREAIKPAQESVSEQVSLKGAPSKVTVTATDPATSTTIPAMSASMTRSSTRYVKKPVRFQDCLC